MSESERALRERLLIRSVTTLLILTLFAGLLRLADPSLRHSFQYGVIYVLLFSFVLALVKLGKGLAAAWLAAVGGCCSIILFVMLDGGAESRLAVYLPMGAVACWSWLGRRAGLSMTAAVAAALGIEWWLAGTQSLAAISDGLLLATHESALFLGSMLIASVIWDLERAITAARSHAEIAESAAEEAREAERSRDRFLETMSHELRTPLDTILGYTEMLSEEEDDPERRIDLSRISAASRHLVALVDDLLDMSHVLAGDLSLHPAAVHINELIAEVLATIEPPKGPQHIEISVYAPPSLPAIRSDARRIKQILINLTSNAIKYTEQGEITIHATTEGNHLQIAVRDTGIGITPERLHELFQPFVQLHEGTTRRPGMGLGLALSQGIAERLGGRIDVSSTYGEGSTFTLILPLAPSLEGSSLTSP